MACRGPAQIISRPRLAYVFTSLALAEGGVQSTSAENAEFLTALVRSTSLICSLHFDTDAPRGKEKRILTEVGRV